MRRIKVVVADDSVTVRKRLIEILRQEPEIEVVGEASDGKTAVNLTQALRPDVVTLDMMMPGMSGLAATEYIMAYCPTPILIVSASMNRGEVFKTYDALAAGAVEVLDKSKVAAGDFAWERKLISTVKLVSRIKVITHPKGQLKHSPLTAAVRESAIAANYGLVAIGASTGGPAAIQEVLAALPKEFPLPILFVIHITEAFSTAFSQWLDKHSPIPVKNAVDGMKLPAPGEGGVIVAPPGRHLVVRSGTLRLVDGAELHSCKPSVDVLFESVATEVGQSAIACLLTGMGKDGALGLLSIRKAGGHTIAQDESSSVVFGMPREAILMNGATQVLPLSAIGPALTALATKTKQKKRSA